MTLTRYFILVALIVVLLPSYAYLNSYYTHGGYPATGSAATSAGLRAELDSITAGFDKLPDFSGNANKPIIVNGAATALSVTTGTLALAGNFATTGAFNTTIAQTASITFTLPGTSGTAATLAGTETLTNKTITAPVFSGSATGTYTLAGTPTITAPIFSGSITGSYTLAGTPTISSPTISSPTISSPTLSGTTSGTFTFGNGGTITVGSNNWNSNAVSTFSGTTRFDANVVFLTDATYDIGASGAFRPNNLYLAGLLDLSGSAAGQVKFPATANASADANTLDDYEEGTWTPGISFGAGTTGLTYTSQTGRYTKIGRLVHVEYKIVLSAKGSSTGTARLTGLPFTVNNVVPSTGTVNWQTMSNTLLNTFTETEINTTTAVFRGTAAAVTSTTAFSEGTFANTTSVTGSFSYTQ